MTAANRFSSPRGILCRAPNGEIWLKMCSTDLNHNIKLFTKAEGVATDILATTAFWASEAGKKKKNTAREALATIFIAGFWEMWSWFQKRIVPGVIWKSTSISAMASFANMKVSKCIFQWHTNVRIHHSSNINGNQQLRQCVCVHAHLEQQAGVLASLSLQQHPLSCSGPEHQAKVPGRGDGHVVLQVPPEGTVTQEAVGVRHHWGGGWEKDGE